MIPVYLPELAPYQERYAALPKRPLRVIVEIETGSNVASYDPVNLDNLLARLVLEEATQGQTRYDCADNEYLVIPTPLHCLWWDMNHLPLNYEWEQHDGLPLWAATPFVPASRAESDVVYWHKRPQEGVFTASKSGAWSPKAAGNRYAERRIGTPVTVCQYWSADCIGNPDEIARLLESVRALGKGRSHGHGVVRSWQIAAIERFALVRDGKLRTNIPEAARHLLTDLIPIGLPSPCGWTPPQWRPALWRSGWRIGTPVYDLAAQGHAS